jgi:hypothetical protein
MKAGERGGSPRPIYALFGAEAWALPRQQVRGPQPKGIGTPACVWRLPAIRVEIIALNRTGHAVATAGRESPAHRAVPSSRLSTLRRLLCCLQLDPESRSETRSSIARKGNRPPWSLSLDPAQLEKSIAKCGAERAGEVHTPFRPVETGDRKSALALLNRREVDPKIAEKGLAVPRHEERSVAEPQATASDERFGESDAETAREVVVARTGGPETFRRCCGTKGSHGPPGRDRREGFHRVRDLAARQSIAPLPTVALHADEAGVDERLEVRARRGEPDVGNGGQCSGG